MPFCTICRDNFSDESSSTAGFICRRCMLDPLSEIGNTESSSVVPPPRECLTMRLIRYTKNPLFLDPSSSFSSPSRFAVSSSMSNYLPGVLLLPEIDTQRENRTRNQIPIFPSTPINEIGRNKIFYSKQKQYQLNINFDQITPPNPIIDNLDCIGLDSITFGDLHGNTLILIMVLVRFGFIEFPNTEHYHRMRQIINDACSQPLTIENYIEFRDLLYQCTRCNKLNIRIIRLLGDIIGDRQSNDALTLAVIGFLLSDLSATFSVNIVFSNHDKNLIDYLIDMQYSTLPFDSLERLNVFFASLNQSDNPARDDIRENIVRDIRSYVSCIKLLDYELLRTEFNIHGHMCIFTHAPLHPIFVFFALLDVLGREHPNLRLRFFRPPGSLADFTKYELIELMNSTNQIFSNMLLNIFNEKFEYTYPPIRRLGSPISIPSVQFRQSLGGLSNESPSIAQYRKLFIDQYSSCSYLIWFRLPEYAQTNQITDLSLPTLVDGVTLFNVHGHDRKSRRGDISLDNNVGKSHLHGECVLRVLGTQKYIL